MTQRVKRVQPGSTGFDVRIKLWGWHARHRGPRAQRLAWNRIPESSYQKKSDSVRPDFPKVT